MTNTIELCGTNREFNSINMKLSVPEITTPSSPESSRLKTRRASFSVVQEIPHPRVRFTTVPVQTPSQPMVTRRLSVCNTSLHPPVLKECRRSLDSISEKQSQTTSLRRGSTVQRSRSNSVFAKGLGLSAFGMLRGRRRSRVLSAREIKLFRVS